MTQTVVWCGTGDLSEEYLRSEIEGALQAIAELNARAQSYPEHLHKWLGSEAAQNFLDRLQEYREREWQRLVLHLADLHHRMAQLAVFD